MLTKKIRIRTSLYELLLEHIYRVQTILLHKNKELGPLSDQLQRQLGTLFTALKDTKLEIEANSLLQTDQSSRSRELNQIISVIDSLVERRILTLNAVSR